MLLRPLGSTFCLTPLLLASALLAQTPPTPAADQPAFTLHANTRLVLTDVTVTDHDGNPVRNLHKSAFHVFDGNTPQDIASLEEHTSTALAETPAPAAPQPRGTYNNDFILHPPPVLDVVLLDVTNLELEDQMYLSYQLTKFLNALPAGQQLAIYERHGANTVLLQNFTSDRKLLLNAVHRGLPRILPTGREYLNDLDTLQQLGLYLSGLPGRKNILWFSGGSTLYLNEDPASTPMEDQALIRRIYDNLEANRIAIYPIDARGLTVNSGSAMINQHFRMNEVAEATGGHAFYGAVAVTGLWEFWGLRWFMFRRRRFPVEIILVCVRWYCKYGISYRDLTEMMQERGVEVDPSTIMRWVHRYAPELEKRVRAYQGYGSTSWRVDETYVKVGGQWKYLFRAVDKHGHLIDFMLSERRNTRAAHCFLSKAVTIMRNWPPTSITTDKLPSYPQAIERLKRDGQLSEDTRHRTSKYLNNIIEADHGALKRVIRPTRGFQTMKTATATIKGFEIMRMIRRGHCLTCKPGVRNEINFVNRLFQIAA